MLTEVTAQVLAMGAADTIAFSRQHGRIYQLAGSGASRQLDQAQAILRYDSPRKEHVVLEAD